MTSILAGYAFAFLRFPFKRTLFVVFLATLMVPFEITIITNLQTVSNTLNVYDNLGNTLGTFAALAVPFLATGFGAYRWDWGPNVNQTGNGVGGEIGFRVGQINPQVNILWFNSDNKHFSSFRAAGGVNYYFVKHNAKLQLEFASNVPNGIIERTPSQKSIVLQAQAAF